jgi:hypothetical protein
VIGNQKSYRKNIKWRRRKDKEEKRRKKTEDRRNGECSERYTGEQRKISIVLTERRERKTDKRQRDTHIPDRKTESEKN